MATGELSLASLFLFVPGDRPDRFGKAIAAGADAVILDLEDAVAADRKAAARDAIRESASLFEEAPWPVFLRINGVGTPEHERDVRLAAAPHFAGVVVPKAEDASSIAAIHDAAGATKEILALIETAAGLANARTIARFAGRLAFGSVDYAADLGCSHAREPLLQARSELVLASRLAGLPRPIDGVTLSFTDADAVKEDAAHAARLGFGGKLLIHPAQIVPATEGLAPSAEELAWARRVLAGTTDGTAAAVDGMMVDAPVRARAFAIERRATRTAPQSS